MQASESPTERTFQLNIVDVGTFAIPAGKRLVNAIEDEASVDQLHACGGLCKCTTCRIRIVAGTPTALREAERAKLIEKGINDPSVRLSCQLQMEGDLTIELMSRLRDFPQRKDAGPRCADAID